MSMFLSQATFQPIATGSRQVASQHKIRPVIDSAYCFEEAKAASTHYAAQNLLGKVVIRH